jgi:CDGSH-type Zn-finger protein/uncharacterized Fe-S cluster protein YjdI
MRMSGIEEARGKQIIIRFEASRCIHSRHCVLDRPDVFVPNVAGEWIHPDVATADEVVELAHNCPSGAIQFERLDGGPAEVPPLVNVIRVRENGPLAVHGDATIAGVPCLRATLCRCGQSANKPYCDSSHKAGRFTATGEPATTESQPLSVRGGALAIVPETNGPLRITGSVELCSGTGRTIDRLSRVALCRCGQSGNKPYCDGSHRRVGFVAP